MSFNINIGRWLIGPYCGESWLSPLSWWNYRERFPFWKSSVSMPGDLFFSIGPIYFSRSECNIGRNRRERERRKYPVEVCIPVVNIPKAEFTKVSETKEPPPSMTDLIGEEE